MQRPKKLPVLQTTSKAYIIKLQLKRYFINAFFYTFFCLILK